MKQQKAKKNSNHEKHRQKPSSEKRAQMRDKDQDVQREEIPKDAEIPQQLRKNDERRQQNFTSQAEEEDQKMLPDEVLKERQSQAA